MFNDVQCTEVQSYLSEISLFTTTEAQTVGAAERTL